MLPTVKIACPANKRAGYAIINESDFDPKRHKLFGEKAGSGADDTKRNNKTDDDAAKADLAAARSEYEVKLGRKPFMGWDAKTLREKIAAASA